MNTFLLQGMMALPFILPIMVLFIFVIFYIIIYLFLYIICKLFKLKMNEKYVLYLSLLATIIYTLLILHEMGTNGLN